MELVSNNPNIDFDVGVDDVGSIILRFLEVVVCSILIGVIIGLLTTVVFKNLRFLVEEKGIAEMALTIFGGYFAYILS